MQRIPRAAIATMLFAAILADEAVTQRAAVLSAGTDTLSVWLVQGADTTPAGRVIDRIAVHGEGAGAEYHRVYAGTLGVLGTRTDTIIDRVAGLVPQRSVTVQGDSVASVTFADGRVRGRIFAPFGGVREIDAELPPGVINGASLDLAIRSAPLVAGDTLRHRLFAPMIGLFTTTTSVVTGVDTLGAVLTWRVTSEYHGSPVVFWIDTTTRRLLRQTIEFSPGITMLFDRRPLPSRGDRPRAS